MKRMLIAIGAMTLLMSGMAYAQGDPPAQGSPPATDQTQKVQKQRRDIDERLMNQRERIDKGIASGHLTEQEATLLNRHHEEIKSMVAEAKSDGVISKEEQAKIKEALDRESNSIKGKKHDAEGKPGKAKAEGKKRKSTD